MCLNRMDKEANYRLTFTQEWIHWSYQLGGQESDKTDPLQERESDSVLLRVLQQESYKTTA